MRKAQLLFLLLLLSSLPAFCRERVWGYCSQGGVQGQVQFSSNLIVPDFQASYPGCTVNVYATGTITHQAIYSDNNGTSKSNPFTADSATGYWFFYVDDGHWDVNLSGGGISTPYTWADVLAFDQARGLPFITDVDTLATTFAGACTAALAAGKSLAITLQWANVPTQSCAAGLTYFPGTNGFIQPASGAVVTLTYPNAAATQQLFDPSAGGTIAFSNPGGRLSVCWWGAKGNGTTNDTAAIAAAATAANAVGSNGNAYAIYFPQGIYPTDPITQVTTYGVTLEGDGPTSSVLLSRTGSGNVIDITGNSSIVVHAVTIKDLGIDGNSGTTNVGIKINAGVNGTFNIRIINDIVNNVGGQCVLVNQNGSFETDIDHVECHSTNNNGIEVRAGPATVIQNSYVHQVGTGYAGYRLYGNVLMLSDNGLDGTVSGSIWAQIGNNSPLEYGFVTFVNCNIEDFGAIGIDVIQGFFKLVNTQIIGNQPSTTVQAIRYETQFSNGVSEMDAQSDILPTGNFVNGYAIHAANGCQPLLVYNAHTETSLCYNEAVTTAYNTLQFNGASAAFGITSLNINELSSPDTFFQHVQAGGSQPAVTAPFGASGDIVAGFDLTGQITIGAAPTNQFGTIAWASTPAYRGLAVNCAVSYIPPTSVENGTVNISASGGGTSTVTWVSGTKFNTGWPSGLPILLSIGGAVGVLSNNIISAVASDTSMTITPGVSGGSSGTFYIMPIRNQYLSWISSTVGLTIRSTYNFVPGDILTYICFGR